MPPLISLGNREIVAARDRYLMTPGADALREIDPRVFLTIGLGQPFLRLSRQGIAFVTVPAVALKYSYLAIRPAKDTCLQWTGVVLFNQTGGAVGPFELRYVADVGLVPSAETQFIDFGSEPFGQDQVVPRLASSVIVGASSALLGEKFGMGLFTLAANGNSGVTFAGSPVISAGGLIVVQCTTVNQAFSGNVAATQSCMK